MKSKHIFVVEDEGHIRLALYFLLKKEGYKVTTIKSGQEALNKIISLRDNFERVDLLLLDMIMPGISGLEVMDELKKLNIKIPTFIMSGLYHEDMADKIKDKGCVGYFEKPIEPKRLIQDIDLLFQKSAQG